MSKKKKFSATEKHFSKILQSRDRNIKNLEKSVRHYREELENVSKENNNLIYENAELKDWVDRLLKYTELSKEDMKKIVSSEKKTSEIVSDIMQVRKVMPNLFRF